MNPAHLHLMVNHIPVVGSVGAFLVLLIGFIRKSDEIKKLGLFIFILVALGSIPAFLSGDKSEKIAKSFPGIEKGMIHDHEEAAESAFITLEIVGGIALLSLLIASKKSSIAKGLTVLVLLGGIASAGMMSWAAKLGGVIRHPETRPDYQVPVSADSNFEEPSQ